MDPETYRSYKDLPPMAGVCSFAEAAKIGLSVDEGVRRLKRYHWAFRRLHGIFVRRLTAEPIYELKMAFSLHAHYCAEHAKALRCRVGEMREPPLGLDAVPDRALDIFFDEVGAVPETGALIIGIYFHALPALAEALRRHGDQTNRLVDHPSFRLCRFALVELDEMIAYGKQAISRLVTATDRSTFAAVSVRLEQLLAQSGSLDGTAPRAEGVPASPAAIPPPTLGRPRRDERFADPYNMGVHAELFLYDEAFPPQPKTLMMFYKRLREIDVPEMMATIIAETTDKPWQYYVEMTRQLWDEARHAMMGEIGFVQAGIDWTRFVRVNFTWSLALNAQLKPIERHAVLYFIEQGLMPKTGKRFEWETGVASGDKFAAMIQDYDWADEVLHARIGRDWFVKEIGDARKAIDYGDDCWSRVLIDWQSYIEKGYTKHENWWPDLYREWCRVRGDVPNLQVLAFRTSYAAARADLREISASG